MMLHIFWSLSLKSHLSLVCDGCKHTAQLLEFFTTATLSVRDIELYVGQCNKQWLMLEDFLHPAQLLNLEEYLHLEQSNGRKVLLATLTPTAIPSLLFSWLEPPLCFLSLSEPRSGHSFFQWSGELQILHLYLPVSFPLPWFFCFAKNRWVCSECSFWYMMLKMCCLCVGSINVAHWTGAWEAAIWDGQCRA